MSEEKKKDDVVAVEEQEAFGGFKNRDIHITILTHCNISLPIQQQRNYIKVLQMFDAFKNLNLQAMAETINIEYNKMHSIVCSSVLLYSNFFFSQYKKRENRVCNYCLFQCY